MNTDIAPFGAVIRPYEQRVVDWISTDDTLVDSVLNHLGSNTPDFRNGTCTL